MSFDRWKLDLMVLPKMLSFVDVNFLFNKIRRLRHWCYSLISKIKRVPSGIQGEKSRKDTASSEQLEHK